MTYEIPGATQRSVDVNGIRLSVHEAGEGPAVVFSHGFPELAFSWRHQLPALAVNGHSVAMTVRVDSPMTAAEHVRAVHLISEKNPVREMATFYLGPHSGRAEVGSRIRLNGTQRITAVAELSDGSFWSDQVAIEVREAACTDGG